MKWTFVNDLELIFVVSISSHTVHSSLGYALFHRWHINASYNSLMSMNFSLLSKPSSLNSSNRSSPPSSHRCTSPALLSCLPPRILQCHGTSQGHLRGGMLFSTNFSAALRIKLRRCVKSAFQSHNHSDEV